MEVHRRLRLSRRARRESEQCNVIPSRADRVEVRRLRKRFAIQLGLVIRGTIECHGFPKMIRSGFAGGELFRQPAVTQRERNLRLVDDAPELSGPEHWHRVYDDGARFRRGEPACDHGRVVRRSDQHAVTRYDTIAVDERMGDAIRPFRQLRVRSLAPVSNQRDPVTESAVDEPIAQFNRCVDVLRVLETLQSNLGPELRGRQAIARERIDVRAGTRHRVHSLHVASAAAESIRASRARIERASFPFVHRVNRHSSRPDPRAPSYRALHR